MAAHGQYVNQNDIGHVMVTLATVLQSIGLAVRPQSWSITTDDQGISVKLPWAWRNSGASQGIVGMSGSSDIRRQNQRKHKSPSKLKRDHERWERYTKKKQDYHIEASTEKGNMQKVEYCNASQYASISDKPVDDRYSSIVSQEGDVNACSVPSMDNKDRVNVASTDLNVKATVFIPSRPCQNQDIRTYSNSDIPQQKIVKSSGDNNTVCQQQSDKIKITDCATQTTSTILFNCETQTENLKINRKIQTVCTVDFRKEESMSKLKQQLKKEIRDKDKLMDSLSSETSKTKNLECIIVQLNSQAEELHKDQDTYKKLADEKDQQCKKLSADLLQSRKLWADRKAENTKLQNKISELETENKGYRETIKTIKSHPGPPQHGQGYYGHSYGHNRGRNQNYRY